MDRSSTLRGRSSAIPLALAGACFAACASPGDRAITAYAGRYTDDSLPESILVFNDVHYEDSRLGALAYSEVIQRFADGDGQVEWELQVAKHWGEQTHEELNALAIVRWSRFPWSEGLRTTLAAGDGLSWASEVPPLEAASHTNEGARSVLNYLLLELTAGLPSQPAWDVVLRVHHRSGIFGLFDGVDGGSNVIAFGIRWRF